MGELSKGTGISSIRGGDFELGASGVSAVASSDVVVEDITPITLMPLEDSLELVLGTGSATLTRSSIGTFEDKDDGLVKTAAIDAARFEQNGILIEGASDNLALRSEEVDNATWAKQGGITFAANQSTGADGLQTADQITYIGGQGSPSTRATQQSVTVPGGTASKTFTVSCWVRSVSGTSKFRFNCTHGGVIAQFSPDITATTTLTRHEFTVTNGVAAGNGIQFIGIIGATDDSAYDLYVWGYQFEELPFPSSYIKTVASTVTRTADNLSIDAANIPAPTADYSVSAKMDVLGDHDSLQQTWYAITGENSRIGQVFQTTAPRVFHGGNAGVDFINGTTISGSEKFAVTFDGSNFKSYQNANLKGTLSSFTAISGSKTGIEIGSRGSNHYLFGHIKDFRIYEVALTAAQVGTL